jgi:menaquinone-dependent protoporphyrinogen oxidase
MTRLGAPDHAPRVTRVLVAFASKHGSTAEIAEAIADKLRESGFGVDCLPVGSVAALTGYDAIVIGSAVYIGHWQPEARRFVHRHARELARRPLWAFSSGPAGASAEALEPQSLEPRRIVADLKRLGAREHVVFGGRLPTEPHGPLQRALVRNTPERHRDLRNWAEIRAWASGIAAELAEPDRALMPEAS